VRYYFAREPRDTLVEEIPDQISDYQRIIGFRNVLAHGYDVVSDEVVWDIVQTGLVVLRQEICQIKRDVGMAWVSRCAANALPHRVAGAWSH